MFRGSSWTQTTGVPSAKGSRADFNCDAAGGAIAPGVNRHVRVPLVADLQELVVYLAAAQQHAAGLLPAIVDRQSRAENGRGSDPPGVKRRPDA